MDSNTDSRTQTPLASLADDALSSILERGAPILGKYEKCTGRLCNWQAEFPDDTRLVNMNLPGTHDTSTWNYTEETQKSLLRYTGPLVSDDYPLSASQVYRCQSASIFKMLDDGIRVFDMRYSWNPGNDTIGLFHGAALLAPTTRLEDVLFGFYTWLADHPTEALLISMKYDAGPGRVQDQKLHQTLYDIFNTDLAKKFWMEARGSLGTLGAARGKMILLQRTPYSLLSPPLYEIGIPLPPSLWTDNGADIMIPYGDSNNSIAYIEDFYEPPKSIVGLEANVAAKLNATLAHLEKATEASTNETGEYFWISFSSAEQTPGIEPISPEMMAIGNGSIMGVNQGLLPWLQERKGKRFGVIMLDWYDSVPGLVEATIGL